MPERAEREQTGDVRQISPRVVIAGVVIVAVLGAVGVFVAGSILHDRDRKRLAAWEAAALPLVQRAEQIHRAMPPVERSIARAPSGSAGRGGALKERVQAFRTELQRIRRTLDETSLPEILVNVGAASYSGVSRSIEAVTALERELAAAPVSAGERTAFRASWTRAGERFDTGRRLLIRVRCRARVQGCETIPFAPRRLL